MKPILPVALSLLAATAVVAALQGQAPSGPGATSAPTYQPVSKERLLAPGDDDWLMIRRTYDGWGYSPLADITPANVGRLKLVWIVETGTEQGARGGADRQRRRDVRHGARQHRDGARRGHREGALALTAAAPEGARVPHDTNRGVALYGDSVFVAAGEAVLVALDAKTGKERWATTVADYKSAYYISMAPLVADGKVLIGTSGGEFGVRGFVAAFDPATGKQLWRTHTVPAPGEPGSETWPKGDQWKTGGAPVWVTGNYDPDLNIAYFGTGNGGPWMGDQRPGDNLYVASTVAFDVATGRIRGHFQYNPNESWDWDEVSPPILVDYQRNGRTVKGLIDVARDGYIWFLERSADGIKFVEGKPYVTQNVFRGLDPVTGRPDVDPVAQARHRQGRRLLPERARREELASGGVQPQDASDVRTGQQQPVRTIDGHPHQVRGRASRFPGRGRVRRSPLPARITSAARCRPGTWTPASSVWMHAYDKTPNWGSMLVTGGGVLFTGGTNDRKFHAFDAATGAAALGVSRPRRESSRRRRPSA